MFSSLSGEVVTMFDSYLVTVVLLGNLLELLEIFSFDRHVFRSCVVRSIRTAFGSGTNVTPKGQGLVVFCGITKYLEISVTIG